MYPSVPTLGLYPADAVINRQARPDRLRASLVISGIIATSLVLVTAVWLAVKSIIQTEHDSAIRQAETDATNLAAAFQEEISRTLSADAAAMELVAEKMRAAQGSFDIHDWARDIPLLAMATIQAGIIGPNGRLLSTTVEAHPAPLDLSDREHFRVPLDLRYRGIYVSKPVVGRLTKQTTIQLSRRVDSANGKFLGIVVFSLLPSQLTSLHKSIDLGQGGLMAIVGATDHVIRARFSAASADGNTGAGATVSTSPPLNGSSDIYFTRSPVDGIARIYARRMIPGYDLFVGVGLDLDEVLGPARAHAGQITIIGVVISLLLISLIIGLASEIYRRSLRQIELGTELRRREKIEAELRASEQRVRDFADTSSDWFWEQDAELRFTWLSDTCKMVTEGSEYYLGKRRWEFTSARATSEEAWEQHRAVLEARKPFRDFRYALRRDDGYYWHLSVSGNPLFDADGKFLGYRGSGRDITEEVAAEADMWAAKERAEQAEMMLRDAVDSISEGFVIYDRDDRLVLCNDVYRHLYPHNAQMLAPGVRFEDLLLSSLAAQYYPEAVGHEQEWAAEFLRDHRAADRLFEQQVFDGRWILVSERRMRNGGIAGLRMDITALKRAQFALRDSEARLDRAQEIAGIGSWELDLDTGECFWSREMFRIGGLAPDSFQPTRDNIDRYLHAEDILRARQWFADLEQGVRREAIDVRVVRSDGVVRICNAEARPIEDQGGRVRKLIGTMQDVTERRLTEQHLAHAQKMETIGNLSGGMAHDFNNVLGAIIGNLDLLRTRTGSDPLAEELRDEAEQAALRGADLTRRLLAFARRQPLRPEKTSINELVDGLAKLLKRMLGGNVDLSLHLGPGIWPVVIDPTQLEAALSNLVANARDAMPKGGRLDIVTRNVQLDSSYVLQHPEVNVGNYVLIEVSDTGMGISADIIGQIFEPFFTTKEAGKGSGLGLSMVFGFIKQSGGHVAVYSEVGLGTTFRLYLPRNVIRNDTYDEPDDAYLTVEGGTEAILVVEDNSQLRRVSIQGLRLLGYEVLEATDAQTALAILNVRDDVRLLFTDVVMPGEIDGLELAARATRLWPQLTVLLTSGFPDMRSSGRQRDAFACSYRMLNKPYRHDELAKAVRELLDERQVELVQ